MLTRIIGAVVVVFGASCAAVTPAAGPPSDEEEQALEVVRKRTEAYNAHDLESFIASYDPMVRVYEYPETLLGTGVERMRKIFGPQFADGEGKIEVIRRRALEHTVISDEWVTLYGKSEHNIGIYTVRDGRIVEVRLVEPAE
ncbi:MAG: nuclear transport factor 2 family protein [Myxococcota bacterium]